MDENTTIDIGLNEEKTGSVQISDEVVSVISGIAAAEVEGVAGMSAGITSGIGEILGRKNLSKGVKVEIGETETAIDLFIIVKYGYKIQEVCKKVQKNIKEAVENMTGLKVVEVNVHVEGVHFSKETPLPTVSDTL